MIQLKAHFEQNKDDKTESISSQFYFHITLHFGIQTLNKHYKQ